MMDPQSLTNDARPVGGTDAEIVSFLAGRSVPCPRCGYDLRDIRTTTCPECAEPLALKIGSPTPRFGWLVFSMAPGLFSGVAACFVAVPVIASLSQRLGPGQGAPWPVVVGDVFGFVSAASVVLMYRHRHRLIHWPTRRQMKFAWTIWGIHVGMLAALVTALAYVVP